MQNCTALFLLLCCCRVVFSLLSFYPRARPIII